MTDQNLPIIHRTTGASVTLAVLVVLGVYACSGVSSLPDENIGGAGSAGAPAAGSGGSGGVSGSSGNAGTGGGGSAGASGSGSSGSGGSSATGGSGGSGSGTGNGGSSSGSAGSSSGTAGASGSSSDPDAGGGSDPDAALADGGEPPIENLISNSDFESGISPWTAAFGGALSATTEQAHTGLQSAKVSGRTAEYQGAHFDVTDFVTSGTSYSLTAFARIAGATSSATVKTTARIKCATLADQYVPIRQLTANDSSWTELTGTLTVPTSQACTLIELLVYVEGPPAAYDLYADDVSMLPL